MRFDIHVHSTISPCSELRLEEILAHSRARKLDGVCITDHQRMEAAQHLTEGIQPDGLCVIVGLEYTTPDGDFLVFGPFDGISQGFTAPELLTLVHERGGVAVADSVSYMEPQVKICPESLEEDPDFVNAPSYRATLNCSSNCPCETSVMAKTWGWVKTLFREP